MGELLALSKAMGALQQEVGDGFRTLGKEIGEIKTQISSFNRDGHASTQLHCAQLQELKESDKSLRTDIETLKEAHRALVTMVAVIVTLISAGGGVGINVIAKLLQ